MYLHYAVGGCSNICSRKEKNVKFLLRPYRINYLFIIPAHAKFTCCANNCLFIIPACAYWPSRRWTLRARQTRTCPHATATVTVQLTVASWSSYYYKSVVLPGFQSCDMAVLSLIPAPWLMFTPTIARGLG